MEQAEIYVAKLEEIEELLQGVGRNRQSAGGRLLLAYGICQRGEGQSLGAWGNRAELFENLNQLLEKGAHGKPYFGAYPRFHFNISHSGGYVACAAADVPCGIDIQEIRGFRSQRLLERTMKEKEREKILASPAPALEFSRLWAKKESIVKLTGKGLSVPMNTLPDTYWQYTFEFLPVYTGCFSSDKPCKIQLYRVTASQIAETLGRGL